MDINNKSVIPLEKRVYGIKTLKVKPGLTPITDTFEEVGIEETLPIAIDELKDTLEEISAFNAEELSNQKDEKDIYLKKILISI